MDLSLIQELLDTFATFGKNIGTVLQQAPILLDQLSSAPEAVKEVFGDLSYFSSNLSSSEV